MRTEVAAVALLAALNVPGAALPEPAYVPVHVAVAGGLVVLARCDGLSWRELGLAREQAGAGLRVGGALAAVVAAGIVLGAALPLTRGFFEDQRVEDVDGLGELAYQTLVRIPLGTVLLEEVAFRGVLLALVARRASTGTAVAVSSALFGLWHVRPTLGALSANDLAGGLLGRSLLVAGAVAFTAVVGVVFCGLRLASGSVLAPALVHVASNSVATTAAYVVLDRAG